MKNKKLSKLETITIIIISISIFIYEICFCNFDSIFQYKTYNFSLYRMIVYIIFGALYIKFSNRFISEAEKTLKNKKKIIYAYVIIATIFIIYKLINEKNYYTLSLIILSGLNGLLFILYITKDYIKNIIVTIITLGFMFSISTNVYNIVDEKKHFVSTLNVAVGNFDLKNGLTNKEFNNIEFECKTTDFAKEYFGKYISLDMEKISENEEIYSTTAESFPLLYLPGSIGINFARLFKGSVADIFFAGRMTNLIFFGILLIMIFKILPFKKDIFYAIYMMPMSIVLAGYYTIDGIVIGLIGVFIAYVFKTFNEKKDIIDLKTFFIIIGLYLLTLTCKGGVYFATGLILFILPVFKTLKENNIIRNISIIIIIAISIGIMIKAYSLNQIYDPRAEKSNSTKQIEFLQKNPMNIINVYSNYIRLSILNFRFYEDFNKFDFFGINAIETSFLLFLFIYYTALMDNSYTFNKKQKNIQYISFFLTFFITTLVLYIIYTEVGKKFIDGYQARYLIPVLPLLLANINSKRVNQSIEKEYNETALIGGFITILDLIFMITT